MATPLKFAAYVRWKTRTTTATFTDDDMLVSMEFRQDEIAKAILKADEDILLVPSEDDLVASTITDREYPIASDMISRIKRVEVKFDGTNFIPLSEIDIASINNPIGTEDEITAVFNNGQVSKTNPNGARFDILRKSLFIYSGTIEAVTDGIKLWYKSWPTPVTDLSSETDLSVDPSTITHGIPRVMHEIWARGVIIDYKGSKEKPLPLSERELNYKADLREAIQALRHGNLDREVIGELPPASDRGNDGFDY